MLGNDGGQSWRLRTGVRCEQLGSQWLVLDVGEHELLRLSGPAAEILTRLAAGETTLPEHLDATVGVLVAKGVLEPAGPPPRGPLAWSRRRVLGLAAASAAAAGVAATVGIDSLVLPVAAQASSPGQFMVTSGGTESSTFEVDGVYYRTRTFVTGERAGGTFTFSVNNLQSADSDRRTIEYFLVGGGGGGGGCPDRTGGGGAGATTASGSFEFTTTGGLTVVVGGGGLGGDETILLAPQDGENSTLSGFSGAVNATAFRGGRGGQSGQGPQVGGGGFHNQSGATRTPGGNGGNGFDGGAPSATPGSGNFAGGGGGGAAGGADNGLACQGEASPPGGQGGIGLESSITGVTVFYGGGGGGGFQRISNNNVDGPNSVCRHDGSDPSPFRAPGGSGGGGSGAGYIAGLPNGIPGNDRFNLNGVSGTNGLGGGGGGAAANDTGEVKGIAGNGGSGIVIIRYQVPPP